MQKPHYIIYRISVNVIGIEAAALLFSNVTVSSFMALFISGIILTFFQLFIRPVLVLLTLPLQILSLGLFYIVINSLLLKITSSLISGLYVATFWTAVGASLIISFISMIFDIMSAGGSIQVHRYDEK